MTTKFDGGMPFETILQTLPDISNRDYCDYDAWTDGKSIFCKHRDAICAVYDLLRCIYPEKEFRLIMVEPNCWYAICEEKEK